MSRRSREDKQDLERIKAAYTLRYPGAEGEIESESELKSRPVELPSPQYIFFGLMILLYFAALFGYKDYVDRTSLYWTQNMATVNAFSANPVKMDVVENGETDYKYRVLYMVYLTNSRRTAVTDWIVSFRSLSEVQAGTVWNAEVSEEDNGISFRTKEGDAPVAAGTYSSFGFYVYSNSSNPLYGQKVTYRRTLDLENFAPFWIGLFSVVVYILGTITSMFQRARTVKLRKQKDYYRQVIDDGFHTFAHVIDARDPLNAGRSMRVAIYSKEIAKHLNLSESDQERAYYAGLLHDIGTIGLSEEILQKKGRLTDGERALMKLHTLIGYDMTRNFEHIPGLREACRSHHERYDGTGYPDGLAGKDIPLPARIIGAAVAFDAMTSSRTYKESLANDRVIREFIIGSGTQFDPDVAKAVLELMEEGIMPLQQKETAE